MRKIIQLLMFCVIPFIGFAQSPVQKGLQAEGIYDIQQLGQRIESIVKDGPKEERPVIGIGTLFKETHYATETHYVDVIRAAGGIPVLFPINDDVKEIDKMLSMIDGLVVPGGEDVHPFFYGEEPSPHFGKECVERDYFEIILIRLAKSKHIPILSVCRGMQVTNVALGGSLCQDIPSSDYSPKIQHGQYSTNTTPHHSISIVPGSRLFSILGGKALVNTHHHQCVKDLAPGMHITATAPDGVPEAMEGEGILCVQFHPESMYEKHPEMLEIYKDLVERAKEFKKK